LNLNSAYVYIWVIHEQTLNWDCVLYSVQECEDEWDSLGSDVRAWAVVSTASNVRVSAVDSWDGLQLACYGSEGLVRNDD